MSAPDPFALAGRDPMLSGYPDSPEAVALALFKELYEAEKEDRRGRNERPTKYALDLFAQCLEAAQGSWQGTDVTTVL